MSMSLFLCHWLLHTEDLTRNGGIKNDRMKEQEKEQEKASLLVKGHPAPLLYRSPKCCMIMATRPAARRVSCRVAGETDICYMVDLTIFFAWTSLVVVASRRDITSGLLIIKSPSSHGERHLVSEWQIKGPKGEKEKTGEK